MPSQLPMVQFFNHLQSSKTKRCGTPYSPAHSNPQSRLHTDQGVTLNPRVLKVKAMRGYGRVIASKKKTCEIQDKEGKTSIPWEVCVWLGQRTSKDTEFAAFTDLMCYILMTSMQRSEIGDHLGPHPMSRNMDHIDAVSRNRKQILRVV